MSFTAALAGNPNCGKTTLFNYLTGASAHVGNWAGVTVEVAEGQYSRGGIRARIVDMPGVYSLMPYSPEEKTACDSILKSRPDVIINVVDVTNPQRNLYLTTQLIEHDVPVVVALNMMDVARKEGISVDIAAISEALGVPVCAISAASGQGIQKLMETARAQMSGAYRPHSAVYIKSDNGDEQARTAQARYDFIERLCKRSIKHTRPLKERKIDDRLDRVLADRIWSLPVFMLIVAAVFYLTFGSIGAWLGTLTQLGIARLRDMLVSSLCGAGVDSGSIAYGLTVSAADGVGAVLGFLPQILILFFFISLLEGSGYMARAAFITDGIFRKVGLTGKSFVPLVLGFGCTVPAVMSAAALESDSSRRMTVALTPYMSCSAKLAVYIMFAGCAFPSKKYLAVAGMYVLGIAVAVLSGAIVNKAALKGKQTPFVLEMPQYRLPRPRNIMRALFDKAGHFITRAGTVILSSTVLIWLLQSFDFTLCRVPPDRSMLAVIGGFIAPILAPLGFGCWQAAAALLSGFIAREMVVSTLGVLYATGAFDAVCAQMFADHTAAGALAFMALVLLLPPCCAAVSALADSMKSARLTLLTLLVQTVTAWCVSFAVYHIAVALGG